MHEVSWTPHALGGLDRLEEFLWQKNPRAATHAVLAIVAATRTLAEFPEAGRLADDLDPEHRELLVGFGNSGYVVSYQVGEGRVEILDVRHMREAGY